MSEREELARDWAEEATRDLLDRDPAGEPENDFDVPPPVGRRCHHIPARPDWAEALVVRDDRSELWAAYRGGFVLVGVDCCDEDAEPIAWGHVAEYGPITVVLDADGNPVCGHPDPEDY